MEENKKQTHALTLDVEKYEQYLADSDASEAQKQELMQIYWDIICEFVTMGFHVHPVQDAMSDVRTPSGKNSPTGTDINDASLNILQSTTTSEEV